jgi:transposase-like protein
MERRTFTREFKVEAVKLIQERGVTVAQAARESGLHGTVLRRCAADLSGLGADEARAGETMLATEGPILSSPQPER